MSPEDHAYVVEHSRRGHFEMALGEPDRFEPVACYLVGAIAVHRDRRIREWRLSHAATGLLMPGIFGRSLVEAIRVARSIDGAIDWSTIKRGKSAGVPRGFTNAKRIAVQSMALSFSHIAQRRAKAMEACT